LRIAILLALNETRAGGKENKLIIAREAQWQRYTVRNQVPQAILKGEAAICEKRPSSNELERGMEVGAANSIAHRRGAGEDKERAWRRRGHSLLPHQPLLATACSTNFRAIFSYRNSYSLGLS